MLEIAGNDIFVLRLQLSVVRNRQKLTHRHEKVRRFIYLWFVSVILKVAGSNAVILDQPLRQFKTSEM